ncbi:hypothetical protein [Campylobacter hyointestinalis]|nr:hypothetical protein [Campylobacter hyointestinalis]
MKSSRKNLLMLCGRFFNVTEWMNSRISSVNSYFTTLSSLDNRY